MNKNFFFNASIICMKTKLCQKQWNNAECWWHICRGPCCHSEQEFEHSSSPKPKMLQRAENFKSQWGAIKQIFIVSESCSKFRRRKKSKILLSSRLNTVVNVISLKICRLKHLQQLKGPGIALTVDNCLNQRLQTEILLNSQGEKYFIIAFYCGSTSEWERGLQLWLQNVGPETCLFVLAPLFFVSTPHYQAK